MDITQILIDLSPKSTRKPRKPTMKQIFDIKVKKETKKKTK